MKSNKQNVEQERLNAVNKSKEKYGKLLKTVLLKQIEKSKHAK